MNEKAIKIKIEMLGYVSILLNFKDILNEKLRYQLNSIKSGWGDVKLPEECNYGPP